jgi:transposase InsO family protein
MAYSINPNLPKARATALKLLLVERLPLYIVAERSGVHRTTLWRWKQKWHLKNCHVTEDCPNRPGRLLHKKVHLNETYYSWSVATISSRPHSNSRAVADHIVGKVLDIRRQIQRCAEVVWHYLARLLAIPISLSSVKRIFKRYDVYGRLDRRKRPYHKGLPRPQADSPGVLVQTDTIHLIDPHTMQRTYVYTVIDLYTRMAYAKTANKLLPGLAFKAVLEARDYFGFGFTTVQCDHGLEFSRYFEERLSGKDIQTRHSRLHRPNDNAHVERFNRTIQEECTGRYRFQGQSIAKLQTKITNYLDYYNTRRVHLGLQLRTPSEMLQRS